jgi:hypothetical protein
MGFNKRFLSKKHIIQNLDRIMEYLDVDAVYTTDEFSREVYRLFNHGKSKEEIIKYINENK